MGKTQIALGQKSLSLLVRLSLTQALGLGNLVAVVDQVLGLEATFFSWNELAL